MIPKKIKQSCPKKVLYMGKRVRDRIFGDPSREWLKEIRKKCEKELPELISHAPRLATSDKKTVLFWTMSPWSYTVIDCILATALRLRGHNVILIKCDGLEFCETEQKGVARIDCKRECCSVTKSYIEAFSLKSMSISEFIEEKDLNEAEKICSGSLKEVRKAVIEGVPVGELAEVNAGYYNGVPATLIELHDEQVFRSACRTGVVLVKAGKKALTRIKPDVVVSTGGRSVIWAPIIELAKAYGISTVNWEDTSIFSNGLFFDHYQPAIKMGLKEVWGLEESKPLSKDERNILNDFYKLWENGTKTPYKYYEKLDYNPDELRGKIDVGGKRIVSLFPSIIREDNCIKENAAFSNQVEWILAILKLAERDKDTQFIVRAHPAESKLPPEYIMNPILDLILKQSTNIPKNVILIPPDSDISSYALAEISDILLVWGGTIGIEFAMKGHRVLLIGNPGYRNKGFTTDVYDEEDMIQKLNQYSKNKTITEEEIRLAEKYAYISRLRIIVKFPFLKGHKDRRFFIPSFKELGVGGNPDIQDLCDCIINNKPFIDIGLRPKQRVDAQ
jgi:hypothetical protein